MYVGAGPLYVDLLGLAGPLCKCDVGLDILCICVASFVCFCLILRMGACNSRITKNSWKWLAINPITTFGD